MTGFQNAGIGYKGPGSGVGIDFIPPLAIEIGAIERFGLDIRSFREPLKRSVQQVMAPSFAANFEAAGRPEGWQPLTDMTLQVKSNAGSRYPPEQPLQRSGLLMKTVQQLNIWTITRDNATIEQLPESVWYGAVQQAGINSGRAQIPSRPFLMFQDEDFDKIQGVFDRWLAERILARWG
jgi:phage gpG-like protein